MWPPAVSVDNLSEISEARTGSTSGRSGYSENFEELRSLLGLRDDQQVFTNRFRIDRRKLEDMILGDNDSLEATHKFFQKVMEATGTHVAWPSRLKIGAKTKKDPHVRVAGKSLRDIDAAKDNILSSLGIRSLQVTLKVNVSYTHHSHIIGEGGQTITRVRQSTGCHIHFPDSNRAFSEMKSNQVSITGTIEGVEKARAQVRELVPLVFCFELPILGSIQTNTESMNYIQHVSDKYSVHVSYRTRSRFHPTLVVVKGREWEVNRTKEATILLIKHMCGAMANQVPVQMTMEISPHHHPMVLGPHSQNLKAIMESTQTQILFPDASDPNIPVLKKSNVTITGQIHDVYNARQQLMGSLPITLIFTLTDTKELIDQRRLAELSASLDVSISTRNCPKQNSISVIVRGVERNTTNVYEARRIILNVDEKITASVPDSYKLPISTRFLDKEEVKAETKHVKPAPEFQLPIVRPAFSPGELSPIVVRQMPMWNLPTWSTLLLPQQMQEQTQYTQPRPSAPPGFSLSSSCKDVSMDSSGYSTFNNISPPQENGAFSDFSAPDNYTSGSLSSIGTNLSISQAESKLSALEISDNEPQTPTNTEWIERTLDSPLPTTFCPSDYEKKRQLAAKAFQNKPKGPEVRAPTPTWSGYGLSLSSPGAIFKTQDFFSKRSDMYNSGIWNNTPPTPQTTKCNFDMDGMFLSASNRTESLSPGLLKRIREHHDLPSLLASLGLEKYIHLFTSQEIDMASFTMFNDQNLKELGVHAYGPRHKMLLAITELRKRQAPALNPAPGAERKFASPGWH